MATAAEPCSIRAEFKEMEIATLSHTEYVIFYKCGARFNLIYIADFISSLSTLALSFALSVS